MTQQSFDLLIIGGGPGGYVAALRGAQLGLRVGLVERAELGGICLNWGCIPTKSLLHTADVLRDVRGAADLGIHVGPPTLDFARVIARSRAVAAKLQRGVTQLLLKAGVTVIAGNGAFTSSNTVVVQSATASIECTAPHVIVATGSSPRALPGLPFDGDRVWSYRDALMPATLPSSLAVIGAGAIGLEFASFYATLGTAVTVIEREAAVLPGGDADVTRFVAKAYADAGVTLHTGTTVASAVHDGAGVTLQLEGAAGASNVKAERVLVAIGLAGNIDGLGLEHTRVRVSGNYVVADESGRTDDPAIFAIGDVTGAPMLAHRASHQALGAVQQIAGSGAQHAPAVIPACTYGYPQTASVGLTESQARANGAAIRVGHFPLAANGKAIAIGDVHGFVKTIFDAGTGALLGAHIVGPDATELIHSFALATTLESTEAELIDTVFPHPTVSEAMHESVLAAFGRPLHI
jgi:dihydrolipoamide dehydrogenase